MRAARSCPIIPDQLQPLLCADPWLYLNSILLLSGDLSLLRSFGTLSTAIFSFPHQTCSQKKRESKSLVDVCALA